MRLENLCRDPPIFVFCIVYNTQLASQLTKGYNYQLIKCETRGKQYALV